MKSVTVKMGSETVSRAFSDSATIHDVVTHPDVKATLGHGDNVRALILGVEQEMSTSAPAGATITVETRTNSKAKRRKARR